MSPWWRRATASEGAFAEQVCGHAPALRRFARRLTRDAAEAEDVVQETVVRALEKRDELRDPALLKPWLLAIARTTWLNSRRGLRHRLEVLDGGRAQEDPAHHPRGDLEREIVDRSLSDEVRAALDALPEDWREALWLREVEDLSYEEIATVLQCPVGTVRSRLARARAAMAARLGKEAGRGL